MVILVGIITVAVPRAEAAPIASRAALDAFLGSSAIDEDFETYAIATNFAPVGATVDSTTVVNGQGPNLVVDGVALSTSSGNIIWQANNYFNIPTKTIGTDVSTDLTVNFTTPVSAFGVDLLNYELFPSTYNVTVYGADDATVIGSLLGIAFPSAVTPRFFGFENASGIGGFRVDQTAGFGPVIDNLEFGAVPEPGSMLLLGTGLAAVARRVRRQRRAN